METELLSELKDVRRVIMQLPNAEEILFEKKRYASTPDITKLKDQQLEAFNECAEFLNAPGGGMHLVRGYAGTGKTFTIGMIIEHYLSTKSCQIALTAPTNKAVKQLLKSSEFTHSNLKYATIHSLLGLREQIDNYGNQKFVQDKKNPPKIEEYQVLVIDEVSMLPDELFEMLLPYCSEFTARIKKQPMFGDFGKIIGSDRGTRASSGLKIIFMGDPAQIPPVGKKDCLPFNEEARKKYNIGVSDLTEIVRQALDNPIIVETMRVRDRLHAPVSFPTKNTRINDKGAGVVFFERGNPDHSEVVEEILELYFRSDNFKLNADFMKVIAWRNKTVNYMNKWIREKLYGEEAIDRIVVGEKLIANKPIFEGPMIIFNSNDELEVISYKVDQEDINQGQYVINYYATMVRCVQPNGLEVDSIIKIVHNDSMHVYEEILDALKEVAKNKTQGTWEAGKAWQDYFGFMENFADVTYNYALTAHKAQGSTYDNCLVLSQDLDANRNVVERNRIKYTALSRPRNLLFIVA